MGAKVATGAVVKSQKLHANDDPLSKILNEVLGAYAATAG
jgi:hypothetical protein